MSIGPYILLLPDIALEKIFSFLSYDEIAQNRVVCSKFNEIGSNLLSRGFMQIERRHAVIFKRVKSLLPRRESERRVHPLFRHCDILSAVETRISMLNMTYMKYIQNNMCCFIPGKVLDELDRVLNIVEKTGSPPRANEILQELRDISSMAMEYFDEKILPSIKGQTTQTSSHYSCEPVTSKSVQKMYFVQPALQEEVKKITKANKRQRTQIFGLSKVVQKLFTRLEKQQNTIKAQAVQLQEHTTKLQEQENKFQQQETTISEMKKQMAEWEQKFVDLSAEVIHSRDDIVKAIFPVPNERSQSHAASQMHKTIIRPRVSQVQTPNTYIVELERKRKASMDADIPNKLRFIMKRESSVQSLKEKVANKINENITQNISKNIREGGDTWKKKYDFSNIFSTSIVDTLLKNSIVNLKSRKRRITTDKVDLINLH